MSSAKVVKRIDHEKKIFIVAVFRPNMSQEIYKFDSAFDAEDCYQKMMLDSLIIDYANIHVCPLNNNRSVDRPGWV